MQFTLTIEIGNDAMCKTEHLADSLRRVALRLEEQAYLESIQDEAIDLPITRGIMDGNGNTVGRWLFDE